MNTQKILIGASAAVLLAAGAWLGAGAYVGHRIEAELQRLQSAPTSPGATLRLAALRHDGNWTGATGQADLLLQPGCDAAFSQGRPVSVRVDYRVYHLPLPGSAARFEWQAQATGDSAVALQRAFGTQAQLSGRGTIGLGGGLRTEMSLPELTAQRAGEVLQLAPSNGFLRLDGQQFGLGWQLPRTVLRGQGQALELKDTRLDIDLKNLRLGTGYMQVEVGGLSASFGQAEGLRLRSEAREQGDRLHLALAPSLSRLTAAGQTFEQLALELDVKNLDTRSVETLIATSTASCGFQALTASESRQAADAALTLLTRGLSVGIGKLTGRSGEGAIDGRWTLELQPAKDGQLKLAAQLRSSGQLDLSGSLLTADQRQMALTSGFAVEEGKGLRASYDYADGLLKVNGRAIDASGFQQMLAQADAQIATQLAAARHTPAQRPAPEAAAQAPQSVPAPAPEATPVAATSADAGPFTPSFDCSKASNGQERLVCADRELSSLDVELSQAYARARERSEQRDELKKSQLDWIKFSLRACSDKPCLLEAYRSRIRALQG